MTKRFLVCIAALTLFAGELSQAQAENVLLLSTANTTNDNAAVSCSSPRATR